MRKNKYLILVVAGFILWIAETAYFGWNARPETAGERTLDFISGIMIGWGIFGDLLKNITIIKRETTVNNINTKTVEVHNPKMKVSSKTTTG